MEIWLFQVTRSVQAKFKESNAKFDRPMIAFNRFTYLVSGLRSLILTGCKASACFCWTEEASDEDQKLCKLEQIFGSQIVHRLTLSMLLLKTFVSVKEQQKSVGFSSSRVVEIKSETSSYQVMKGKSRQ